MPVGIGLSSYLIQKFSSVINHSTNKGISTMVNGTLLNIGKRYEDNLRVIFDQWSKLPFNFRADLDFTSRP